MDPAIVQPVMEFLQATAPFDELSNDQRLAVSRAVEISYSRRGAELRALGASTDALLMLRSGSVDELDAEGQLVTRYAEGQLLGAEALFDTEHSATRWVCQQDTLLYRIAAPKLLALCEQIPSLQHSLGDRRSERLRRARVTASRTDNPLGVSASRVSELLRRSLVAVDQHTSIGEAARRMTAEGVSSVLVTGAEHLGIVTDRDLRVRVVAAGVGLEQTVASVMSAPVKTIESRAPVFEAMLTMLDAEIHHLVVVEAGHPVGLITATDVLRLETENPVYFVNELNKQSTRAGLVEVASSRRGRVLARLVAAGAHPLDVHRVLTSVADTITRRLIALAEEQLQSMSLGPLPTYCWVALGSQARREMTLGSDQDNALILASRDEADNPALRWLAEQLSDGLDECGYPKCRGDIMASVPRFRQPLEVWQTYFERWIRQPELRATMEASIFFDMRAIAGDGDLVQQLLETVSTQAQSNTLFLAHLANDAMVRRPPLGLFRQFVLEKDEEHADTLDLKHRGLVPVVDLARFFALECGCPNPSTQVRLETAAQAGQLSSEGAGELQAAFEWIALLRLQHQARCLADGRVPDSYVAPGDLSSTERRHLHDAFKVIAAMQQSVRVSRQLGVLG